MSIVNIQIEEKYYSKDPQSTELGRKIISSGVELMDKLGFEEFTFKKLAKHIGSTEASIYRYFENKLKLLVYLTSWYWAWIEYMIDYQTHHIEDDEKKLKEVIRIVCHADRAHLEMNLPGVDTFLLRKVVVSESDKTYLTKKVDEINNQGLFMGFKGLCHKIALIISKINKEYKHPHSLVSTLLEAAHQQAFFAMHLPSLTEVRKDQEINVEQQVFDFVESTAFKILK